MKHRQLCHAIFIRAGKHTCTDVERKTAVKRRQAHSRCFQFSGLSAHGFNGAGAVVHAEQKKANGNYPPARAKS